MQPIVLRSTGRFFLIGVVGVIDEKQKTFSRAEERIYVLKTSITSAARVRIRITQITTTVANKRILDHDERKTVGISAVENSNIVRAIRLRVGV